MDSKGRNWDPPSVRQPQELIDFPISQLFFGTYALAVDAALKCRAIATRYFGIEPVYEL